jgi:hypothetical protein
MRYRVCWRKKVEKDKIHHGEWLKNKKAVLSAIHYANREYPELEHWLESDENAKDRRIWGYIWTTFVAVMILTLIMVSCMK